MGKYHANGYQEKARVAIRVLDKIDLKTKTVSRDKDGYSGTIRKKKKKKNNCKYAPDIGAPQYIQQLIKKNIKELIDNNPITVGDFNTQLHQWTDHLSKTSVRKQ